MTITVGERLPEVNLWAKGAEGLETHSTSDVFAGKTIALVGVPGAFTGTCQNTHVPNFIAAADKLQAGGVDEVICIAVNDPHVMATWGDFVDPDGRLRFLSDGNAEFARATGLDIDVSMAGMGTRMNRFAMLVRDGEVAALNIETSPGVVEESSAEKLLEAL